MNYEDALERAQNLASNPAALEAFLRSVEEWRPEIEADLRLARSTSQALNSLEPRPEAAARAERQLLQLVGVLDSRREVTQRLSWSATLGRLWQRRLVMAGALAAVLVVAGVLLESSGDGRLGPTTAEAVVIEGSVTAVTADSVTLETIDGSRTFSFDQSTQLQDGFGNAADLASLQPGQIVVLTARPSDGVLIPQRVEIKDRLFGTIVAVTADSVTLQTGQAQYFIRLSPQTEIEGRLAAGVFIEVDVEQRSDGSFWAEEIEVEDRDDNSGPGSGDDDDRSGPGGGDDDDNSGPGGGGDDDDDDDDSGGDRDNSGPGNADDR